MAYIHLVLAIERIDIFLGIQKLLEVAEQIG